MNQSVLKFKRYNEAINMIKLFFTFFGGTLFLLTLTLLIESIA